MNFEKEKHGDGYVIAIHSVVSRYRKTDKVVDGVEMYSAEFNNIVKFDLKSEEAAKDWIMSHYIGLARAVIKDFRKNFPQAQVLF